MAAQFCASSTSAISSCGLISRGRRQEKKKKNNDERSLEQSELQARACVVLLKFVQTMLDRVLTCKLQTVIYDFFTLHKNMLTSETKYLFSVCCIRVINSKFFSLRFSYASIFQKRKYIFFFL